MRQEFRRGVPTNHLIKNVELNCEINLGTQILQQKARPKPIQLQEAVSNEIKN